MARGRFISKEICVDKKVNSLESPWSMLAFTWLLTHADCEGRTYGDPSVVRSLVFPRQDGAITTSVMAGYIQEWHNAGLIIWYEVDGDKFIQFPNFEKHQIGLRKDKEPRSTIPANIRQNDGKLSSEEKRIEDNVNGIEDNIDPPTLPTFQGDNFVLQVYSKVTTFVSIPGDQQKVFDAIEAMRSKHKTIQEMVIYLKPFYEKWCKSKKKGGGFYSKLNHGWLDWALIGETPDTNQSESDKLIGTTNEGELWQRPDGSHYYKIDGREVEG